MFMYNILSTFIYNAVNKLVSLSHIIFSNRYVITLKYFRGAKDISWGPGPLLCPFVVSNLK